MSLCVYGLLKINTNMQQTKRIENTWFKDKNKNDIYVWDTLSTYPFFGDEPYIVTVKKLSDWTYIANGSLTEFQCNNSEIVSNLNIC